MNNPHNSTSTDFINQSDDHLPLLKLLLEQSSDAIFVACPDSAQLLYCNRKACQNLDYELEELTQKKIFEFAQNVSNLDEWKSLVNKLKTVESMMFETGQRRKDGTFLPVEVHVRLVKNLERSYMISIARDISKRKQSEALLISELGKTEAFMQALDDKITVQDKNLKITYQNKAHQEMQGSHIGDFCYKAYHGKNEPCDGCLVLKSFEDGEIHKREITALTEKRKIHLEVISCPVQDSEGEIISAIEIVRDITKHKESEEVLQNMAQVRRQFISTAAHELSTPLASILGYSELMSNPEEYGTFTTEQQTDFIDIIHNKAKALTELVDSLLDISRIDAGQQPTVQQEFYNNFEQIIRTTIESYNNLFPKHTLEAHLPAEGLEPLWIDNNKMIQVLENLLSNAVKYSPDGGRISLSVEQDERQHHFTLADEGIGMTSAQVKRIFEPFYRAESNDPEIGGLGLGMSIVKQIMRGHQGYIRIENNSPKGLKVIFSLPRKKPKLLNT